MDDYYNDRLERLKNEYPKKPVSKQIAERLFQEIKDQSYAGDFKRRVFVGVEGSVIYNCRSLDLKSKSHVPEKIRKIIDSEDNKDEFPYVYYHLVNVIQSFIGPLGLHWYKCYFADDVKKAWDIYEGKPAKKEKEALNDLIVVPDSNNKNKERL